MLLGGLRWRAQWAALTARGAGLVVALAVYGMPAGQAVDSGAYGMALGTLVVLWITLNASWIYNLTVASGHFAVLRRSFSTVSDDQRVQAVVIAFCFGALLEALAGGGAPVAVTAGMLIIVLASRDDEMLLRGHGTPEELITLLADLGAGEVVLRDGPRGSYVLRGERIVHVPTQPVERIVDTTAAGDAFAGAYLAARLGGDDPAAAAALGNRVATTTIQHPGALTPRDLRLTDAHPLASEEHPA